MGDERGGGTLKWGVFVSEVFVITKDELDRLREEVSALKHDIERHVKMASDCRAENERLKACIRNAATAFNALFEYQNLT